MDTQLPERPDAKKDLHAWREWVSVVLVLIYGSVGGHQQRIRRLEVAVAVLGAVLLIVASAVGIKMAWAAWP